MGAIYDALDATCLIAELDTHLGSYVERSLVIDRHAVSAGLNSPIFDAKMVEALLVGERSVGLYLVAVYELAPSVRYVEETLIRRELDSVRKFDPFVDHAFFAVRRNEPHFLRFRVGDVDVAVVGDCDVVGTEAFGDDRLAAIGLVGDDLLVCVGACVEFAVGTKLESVGAGVLVEDACGSIRIGLEKFAGSQVGEKEFALSVDCWPLGKGMPIANELPFAFGSEEFCDRSTRAVVGIRF